MEKYQTIVPRICAILLDGILLLPLVIVDDWVKTLPLQSEILIGLLFIVSLANGVYFIIMHTLFGQTVGKMLMKVKVLAFDESPINFRQAILRDLPQIIFLIGSFIFIDPLAVNPNETTPDALDIFKNPIAVVATIWGITDIIFFFVMNKHRALHDFVAGTVVVKCEDKQ
jgi:uncharacterized RDD family membrane protein YckC